MISRALFCYFSKSKLPHSLFSCASDNEICPVLHELENPTWKSIAFYSKKHNSTKLQHYDTELLKIYLSIKYFKHGLEGRTFIIYTDNKPLIFAFHQKLVKAASRRAANFIIPHNFQRISNIQKVKIILQPIRYPRLIKFQQNMIKQLIYRKSASCYKLQATRKR